MSSIDNNSLYSDYVKPKDWGIVQPLDRHLCLSNGNRCSPRTTQLVSFDPKSNTLIRVREHPNSNNASDDEDLRSVVAEDSAKAFSSRSCFKSPVAENYDVLQRSPTMINNDVLAQECSLDSAVPSLVAPVLPKTTNLLPFSTGKSPIFTTSTINPAAESGHHLQQESFTNNILENKRNQSNNKPPAVIRQRVPFPPPAALPSSSFNATNPNNFILYQMDRPSFDADSSVYNTEYWSFHRKNSEPENVVQQNQGIPKTNLLMDEQNHSSSSLSQSCNHQESPESWPIEEGPFTSFPAARNRSPRRLSLVGFSAASAIRLSSPNGDL